MLISTSLPAATGRTRFLTVRSHADTKYRGGLGECEERGGRHVEAVRGGAGVGVLVGEVGRERGGGRRGVERRAVPGGAAHA